MAAQQEFNLTRAAYFGRRFILFGSITLVALVIGRFVLTAGVAYWIATHPEAPPPPTVGFGLLPPVAFPAQTSDDKPGNYSIEIPSSRMPVFSDRAKVFLMNRSTIDLFTDQKANQVAASYGFVFSPTPLTDTMSRWSKTQPLQATLEMNIKNLNFEIRTNYLSQPQLLGTRNLPSPQDAAQVVKSYINAAQGVAGDIATASGQVKYVRSLGGDLTTAEANADADFLQVDIRRMPVDGDKPFFTPTGADGVIHAIVSGSFTGKDRVVEMKYFYQPIDYAERHTYPLRTVESAWQLVQAGEAYVAQKPTSATAVIRNISLGYYEDPEEEEYMQPIYVFEGDDGFIAYVPALQSQYYQSSQNSDPATADDAASE